jgi:hypothetical protein
MGLTTGLKGISGLWILWVYKDVEVYYDMASIFLSDQSEDQFCVLKGVFVFFSQFEM